MALSEDLRLRIIWAWQRKGLTTKELAETFDVGAATVTRLKRLYRETGSVEPRPHGGGRQRVISEAGEGLLDKLMLAHPDWTEDAYAKTLLDEHGISASAATVGRVIRRLGYVVKKVPHHERARQGPRSGPTQCLPTTESASETSLPRVWFLWARPARTRR